MKPTRQRAESGEHSHLLLFTIGGCFHVSSPGQCWQGCIPPMKIKKTLWRHSPKAAGVDSTLSSQSRNWTWLSKVLAGLTVKTSCLDPRTLDIGCTWSMGKGFGGWWWWSLQYTYISRIPHKAFFIFKKGQSQSCLNKVKGYNMRHTFSC